MNEQTPSADYEISDQAAWFVARLYSGDMTAEEEARLHDWLRAGVQHQREYDLALACWDDTADLGEDPDIMAFAASEPEKRKGYGRWLAIAAVLLLVALPFGANLKSFWPVAPETTAYETAVGEQQVVDLADGSKITLNTGTRVRVDYGKHSRQIVLEYGEAYFDVVKEAKRPLSVSAGGHVVTVLGTSFNVFRTGKQVEVVVLDGAVGVSEKALDRPAGTSGVEAVILRAGVGATFRQGSAPVVQETPQDIERVKNWLAGYVRFDNEPLYRVVGEINRHSPKKILIEDTTIMNMPISGSFKLVNIDLVLAGLEDVFPLEVTRYPDRYVLLGEAVAQP